MIAGSIEGVGMTYVAKKKTRKIIAKRIPDRIIRNQYKQFFNQEERLDGLIFEDIYFNIL
jgi:hypothetical protein